MQQFFETIAGDCLSEFTDLRIPIIAERDGSITVHHSASIADAVKSCTALLSSHNLFTSLGLMPKQIDSNQRGSESNVQVLLGLVIDVDCDHPLRGKKGHFKTVVEANNALVDLPLKPTMIVGTGFGVHAYWLWHEPWLLDDEERMRAKATSAGWNHAAARLLQRTVDSTFALNHIYRVPGTINFKYAEKPKAEILHLDTQRYDPLEFEPFLEDRRALFLQVPTLRPSSDISEKVRNLITFVPEFAEQWHHTAKGSADTSQSGWDWRMAQIMVGAGLNDDEIANALVSNREHWKGKRKPARYYGVTIAKIRSAPVKTPSGDGESDDSDDDPERVWYKALSAATGVYVDKIERSDVRGSMEDCTYWVNFRSGNRVLVRKDSQIRNHGYWTRTLRGASPSDQCQVPTRLPKWEWEAIIEKLWAFARIPSGSDVSLTRRMATILLAYLDQNEVAVDDIGTVRKNDRRPIRFGSTRYFLRMEFLQWHQKSYGKIDESVLEETLRIVHSGDERIGKLRLRYLRVNESDLRLEALGGEEGEGGFSGVEADDDRGSGFSGLGDQGDLEGDGNQSGDPEEGGGEDSLLYTH